LLEDFTPSSLEAGILAYWATPGAPGLGMRQKEEGENMGKDFFIVSVGRSDKAE
jgi:hypothetical protein